MRLFDMYRMMQTEFPKSEMIPFIYGIEGTGTFPLGLYCVGRGAQRIPINWGDGTFENLNVTGEGQWFQYYNHEYTQESSEYIAATRYHLNKLSSIDINGIHNYNGSIEFVDVGGLVNLRIFRVAAYLNLQRVNVRLCPLLEAIDIYHNELTELDLSTNPLLSSLYAQGNNFTCIDVRANPLLTKMHVGSVRETLDLSNNPLLTELDVSLGYAETVDLSHNPLLTALEIGGPYITDLDISANPLLNDIVFHGMPSLPTANSDKLIADLIASGIENGSLGYYVNFGWSTQAKAGIQTLVNSRGWTAGIYSN